MAFWRLYSAPNSFSIGAQPWIPLDSLQHFPRLPSWFKGALLLKGGKNKEREGRGQEGKGKRGRPLTQSPGTATAPPRLYNSPPSIPAYVAEKKIKSLNVFTLQQAETHSIECKTQLPATAIVHQITTCFCMMFILVTGYLENFKKKTLFCKENSTHSAHNTQIILRIFKKVWK